MRKFYVLNIEQGSEDPNNIKKVIRDPKSQGGEDVWPLIRGPGSPRGQAWGPCSEAKIIFVSSA